jgi:hypothetical protein
VLVVGGTFQLAPWADVLYSADYRFWAEYVKDIRATFQGECWTMALQAKREFGINVIGRAQGEGYSLFAGAITTGGNSGYQAVHLAAYWGASRIIMLGYDMQNTNGKVHHFGNHRGGLPNGRGSYGLWIRRFAPLVRDLTRVGVEVLNCSRTTALNTVKRAVLEEVVW